jgi:hypothetical protein
MSFSPWLFVLGTIFEETSSAPVKLEKKTFYRLSIGIWCLMVAILTNCYNGLMITGLNSPLPGSKMESFRDLLCDGSLFENKQNFNLTQWLETSKISWYWNQILPNPKIINPYESRDCFRIWSPDVPPGIRHPDYPFNNLFYGFLHLYFVMFTGFVTVYDKRNSSLLSYSDKLFLSFMNPSHGREPVMLKQIRTEEQRFPSETETSLGNQLQITNCDQKSAYITSLQGIEIEMDFLSKNYADIDFYTGKENDIMLQEMQRLVFQRVRNTKIPSYYRWMIDSGIYTRLEV